MFISFPVPSFPAFIRRLPSPGRESARLRVPGSPKRVTGGLPGPPSRRYLLRSVNPSGAPRLLTPTSLIFGWENAAEISQTRDSASTKAPGGSRRQEPVPWCAVRA